MPSTSTSTLRNLRMAMPSSCMWSTRRIPHWSVRKFIGYITDVQQPAGFEPCSSRLLPNHDPPSQRQKKSRSARTSSTVASCNINPVAQQASRSRCTAGPCRTASRTPGPVAWQMNMRPGAPSTVHQYQSQSLGGYVYTSKWPIVVNQGTAVTVELASNLTIP